MSTNRSAFESPIGILTLVAGERCLRQLRFPGRGARAPRPDRNAGGRREDVLDAAAAQLGQYFAGERTAFELPVELAGSPFQSAVWAELRQVPFGTTVSYGELARRIGRPGEAREVGAAVGSTPVPIVIPCHRVIGADGSLTGYGGGLERKRFLLELEARVGGGRPPAPDWSARQLALG